MTQKTTPVPDELLRELKRLNLPPGSARSMYSAHAVRVAELIDNLPDPPKPDVVEECERARLNSYSRGPMAGDYNRHAMRAALRRYRELGCPELEE